MGARFRDRVDAGRQLAQRLESLAPEGDVAVFALPRGGVPVAVEVARALGAPLDLLVVRKLGVPRQPELAFGAIASGGVRVINDDVVAAAGLDERAIERVAAAERRELERRERAWRGLLPIVDPAGRTCVVVDDGLATGATMRSAVAALRARGARRVIAAAPVGAPETCALLAREADGCACVLEPRSLVAIGLWYDDFRQLEDDEVRALLEGFRASA